MATSTNDSLSKKGPSSLGDIHRPPLETKLVKDAETSIAKKLNADKRFSVLFDCFSKKNHSLYLVGGAIRDWLLGQQSNDIDLATELSPGDISSLLESEGIRVIETGKSFLTITAVPIPGEPGVQISSFRSKTLDNGEITFSNSIEEDLLYRDFTINSIAFEPSSGKLVDIANGLQDLRERMLQAVGDPAVRFTEDPLRIIRMCRIACQFDLSIGKTTLSGAYQKRWHIRRVSVERIRDEFTKLLCAPDPSKGFSLLREVGLLAWLLPEVESMRNFEQNDFHKHTLLNHTLEVVNRSSARKVERLAALLHDVGKPATLHINQDTGFRHFFRHEQVGAGIASELLKRFRFSQSEISEVLLLIRAHMRPLNAGKGGIRRLLRDTGESFSMWRSLKVADMLSCKLSPEEVQREIDEFDARVDEVQSEPDVSPLSALAINGNDLIELGFKEGPLFGEILSFLHEQVLQDPSLNNEERLIALTRKVFSKA